MVRESSEAKLIREGYRDRVKFEITGKLKHGIEVRMAGGHRYGFYLRGPGWPGERNGFYVLSTGRPCLVHLRASRIVLPASGYELTPNNGSSDKLDNVRYTNVEFTNEPVTREGPSSNFIRQLVAIINSGGSGK